MLNPHSSLRTLLPLAIAAVGFSTSSANAATIQMSSGGNGTGGNYSFKVIGNSLNTDGYEAGFSGDWFGTFCLEKNEYFANGGTYFAELSGAAHNGGNGGATNGSDPISAGTAFLYESFALGDLPGGADMQDMIWFLEDEQGQPAPNSLSAILVLAFGANWADVNSAARTDYAGSAVRAMNLTGLANDGSSIPTDRHQDQLFYTGTGGGSHQLPEGGATLVLLSLSVLGLGFLSRRHQTLARIPAGASTK